MKASRFRPLIAVLFFILLGSLASNVNAVEQQAVFEADHDSRTQGLMPDQVEQLENTEKFTFQVSSGTS